MKRVIKIPTKFVESYEDNLSIRPDDDDDGNLILTLIGVSVFSPNNEKVTITFEEEEFDEQCDDPIEDDESTYERDSNRSPTAKPLVWGESGQDRFGSAKGTKHYLINEVLVEYCKTPKTYKQIKKRLAAVPKVAAAMAAERHVVKTPRNNRDYLKEMVSWGFLKMPAKDTYQLTDRVTRWKKRPTFDD